MRLVWLEGRFIQRNIFWLKSKAKVKVFVEKQAYGFKPIVVQMHAL
jgi:hypothetical protein